MGVANRVTKTSRKPGAKVEASHAFVITRIGPCEKCGGLRYLFPTPHAPHWNAAGEMVDCVGDVLRKATR